tara:strand:- start:1803 stop:2132 length:330 start_codon:yes stop_codon:yes gene_type:complete
MIILLESVLSQTFKFIPRSLDADSMVIEDDAENTSVTIDITPSVDRYYLSVSEVLTLVEGRFYTIKVLNGLDVVYKDKIFCTNQTVSSYSINDNEYVQHSTNNDFVIID